MNTSEEFNEQNENPEPKYIFNDEAIENILGVCKVLERIHRRLVSEGVDIEGLKKKYPPIEFCDITE